jgi:DNA-damage-inducible protein D
MEEIGDLRLTMALFENFTIRRTWHEGRWFFSVVDIIAPLSGSPNPRRYWSDLKKKLKEREGFDASTIVQSLPMPTSDGRKLRTDCADIEGILRLVQSVPSPNAEPLKQWLAQVGAETLEDNDTDAYRLRTHHRLKLHYLDTALMELVAFRGIITPEQKQALRDSNYAGLYGMSGEQALVRFRRLPFGATPEEFMGTDEYIANEFQRSQTALVIKQRNIKEEAEIRAVAEDVGVQIRLTIERIGGVMPEDMPRYRRLARGEWMTPELLHSVSFDWGGTAEEVADRVIPIYELVEGDSEPRLIEERHINPKSEPGEQ